jgi:hypothetical protein
MTDSVSVDYVVERNLITIIFTDVMNYTLDAMGIETENDTKFESSFKFF